MNIGQIQNLDELIWELTEHDSPSAAYQVNLIVAHELGIIQSALEPEWNLAIRRVFQEECQYVQTESLCWKLPKPDGYFWQVTEAVDDEPDSDGPYYPGFVAELRYFDDSDPKFMISGHCKDAYQMRSLAMIEAWCNLRYKLAQNGSDDE